MLRLVYRKRNSTFSLSTSFVTCKCQEASGAISGSGVYGKLKFESGIHRVQVLPLPPIQYINFLLFVFFLFLFLFFSCKVLK